MYDAFAGLAYEQEADLDREFEQEQGQKMLSIQYNETVFRIAADIFISDADGSLHRIRGAVWDTGASSSCISADIAKRFGLQRITDGMLVTATGSVKSDIFLTDIHLSNDIILKEMRIWGSPMKNRTTPFLIGMDIISRGKLVIDSLSGKTRVSFIMN